MLTDGLGGGLMSGLLKCWQAIAESHPREIVTEPRVMSGRKGFRMIEATRGYVDESDAITVLVR